MGGTGTGYGGNVEGDIKMNRQLDLSKGLRRFFGSRETKPEVVVERERLPELEMGSGMFTLDELNERNEIHCLMYDQGKCEGPEGNNPATFMTYCSPEGKSVECMKYRLLKRGDLK